MHALRWLWQPLTAFALALLVVLNFLLAWLWYQPAADTIQFAQQRLGESLVRTLAFDIAAPLQRSDRLAISLLLNRTAEEPLVASASLTASAQNLTLNSRPVGTEPMQPIRFEHPVHFESTLLGQAEVQLDQRPLVQWRTRTQRSWFLFNVLALAAAGGMIYWRSTIQEASTQKLARQLSEQLPGWRQQFSGPPEAQLKALVARLSDALDSNSQVLRTLATTTGASQAERLLEQVHLAGEQGAYCDVALLHVQCHNWDALTRQYDAHQLQALWARYENLITQVGELYGGVLLPEGFTLVFGLGDDDHYAMHAVSAARVLQLASMLSQYESHSLQPAFGYSLSAGPAFVSRTVKHGLPLPLVAGDAAQWLQQVSALQPRGAIYLAEPLLQHQEVNQAIEVSLLRDITLSDGGRLEVWELDAIAGHRDRLLASQAQTLVDRLG